MTREEKLKLAIKKGFTYNPENGLITTPTGVIATKKTVNGYIQITIRMDGNTVYVLGHQFAWYYVYKDIVECLDHINRIKSDNRILNLRSVTKSQNAMNMTNVKGYSYCKRSNRFVAYIMVNYKKNNWEFLKRHRKQENVI